MSIAEKLTTIAQNEQKIFDAGYAKGVSEGGGDSYYDEFWDQFQQNGERIYYWGGFAGTGWTDKIFEPKYSLDKVADHGYMFRDSKITAVPRLCITANSILQLFYGAKSVKTVEALVFTKEVTRFNGTFDNAIALEDIVIEGTIGGNGFDVHWSTKLSKASIISIINALSTTANGLSITLSKTAVNNAFGIDVDDTSTWGEGTEFYNLRHSKDNWSISYL